MIDKNNFANLSHEELLAKQKSLSNWQKIFITITAVLVAMTLYAVYKHNIGKHAFLILGSLLLMINNSDKLKKVEEELAKRNN